MYRAVIFDLDGTLTDSLEGIMVSAAYGLKAIGIEENDPEKLKTFAGPPLRQHYMEFAGVDEETAYVAIKAFKEKFAQEGATLNKLFPNVREMLYELKRAGVKVALATTKDNKDATTVLRLFEIEGYFDAVITTDDCMHVKTKAEMIDKALEACEVPKYPGSAVMVGDRFYDIDGGREAGIDTIGVLYGFGDEAEIAECSPTYTVRDTLELKNLLLEQSGFDGRVRNRDGSLNYKRNVSVGRKIWDVIYPVLIYEGLGAVTFFVVSVIFAVIARIAVFSNGFGSDYFPNTDNISPYSALLMYALSILIFVMLFLGDRRKYGLRNVSGVFRFAGAKKTILALLLGMLMSLGINFLLIITGLNEIIAKSAARAEIFSYSLVFELLLVCLLGPITEEIFFRGILFERLRRAISFWPAAIIASAIFGVLHGELITDIVAFLCGIAIAYVYEKTGSLAVTAVLHMAYNTVPVLVNVLLTSATGLACIIITAVGIIGSILCLILFAKMPEKHQKVR